MKHPLDAAEIIKQNLLPRDTNLQWHNPDTEQRIKNLINSLESLKGQSCLPHREQQELVNRLLTFLNQVRQSYQTGNVAWLQQYQTNQINRDLHSITFWVEQFAQERRKFLIQMGATAISIATGVKILNWLLEHRNTSGLNNDLRLLGDEELLERMSLYQNPFRKEPNEVLLSIRETDKYGARRERTTKKSFTMFDWKLFDYTVNEEKLHHGLDLVAPLGTVVYPLTVGQVTEVRTAWKNASDWRMGSFVKITSPNYLVTIYGHLDENVLVRRGQFVTFTTPLARTGNTGNVEYESHGERIRNYCLHISTLIRSREVDPIQFLHPGANFYDEVRKNPNYYLAYFKNVLQTTS